MGADIDWKSIIYRGVESDELDYKAAQNWLQLPRSGKAKPVRHCLAMANTKGGYVVVGVGEDASGQPAVFTGLTPEEAQSFDPTAVATSSTVTPIRRSISRLSVPLWTANATSYS
ncbi:MAG: RNA-binding domain-containing protein [Victivallales bacterium]